MQNKTIFLQNGYLWLLWSDFDSVFQDNKYKLFF